MYLSSGWYFTSCPTAVDHFLVVVHNVDRPFLHLIL